MATITLSDILDDLRAADRALRKFEQRYWLGSDVFYDLYSQGLLYDGSHAEDFAEWAGHSGKGPATTFPEANAPIQGAS